jgi:hypothetical protein
MDNPETHVSLNIKTQDKDTGHRKKTNVALNTQDTGQRHWTQEKDKCST